MPAVYSTPATWEVGELATAAKLNEQLRDNITYLFTRPRDEQLVNEATNYTTTSTTFVDVDATDLSKTITTTGGDILAVFVAPVQHSALDGKIYLDFMLNGARQGGDDGLAIYECARAGQNAQTLTIYLRMTDLIAGSYTLKVQWKTSGATATMFAGAGTSNYDLHPFLDVREV